jgi:N-acetylneuraminic acid mutarotase
MCKLIFQITFSALFLSIIVTCDTYEFPESPYPRVEIRRVHVQEKGVIFEAGIIQTVDKPIINHGFVWGLRENLFINTDDNIQLGELSAKGSFEYELESGLYEDSTYYVRAFIATDTHLFYGTTVSFNSKGSNLPTISSFSPSEGTWGDTVILKGKYFSSVIKNNKVEFGTQPAKILSSTDSTIISIVPDEIPDKTIPISLTVTGYKTQSTTNFQLVTPAVASVSPQAGTFGDVVTLTGSNFSARVSSNIVKFNEHVAEVVQATKTELKVKVPFAISAKENVITVVTNLQSSNASEKFNILPPSISVLSTDKAFIGATLQVYGDNFNPTVAGNTITLGGVDASVVSASKSLIVFAIPEGIYKSRSFHIEVKAAEQTAYSPGELTLQDPWLKKADIPHGRFGRSGAVAFAIDGVGYVGLGGGEVGNNFWKYDPQENLWTEVAEFPGGERWGASSFVIDKIAYVGLGNSNDFWKYDPSANQWSRVADFPYSTQRTVGLSSNGKGYIVSSQETENFYEYDPLTDSWTKREDYPGVHLPYVYPDAGLQLNDKLYIYSSDNSTGPNQFYQYDPGTNIWTEKAQVNDYGFSRGVAAFAVDGHGYVRGESFLSKYNPTANTWQNYIEGDPGQRAHSLAFVINGKVYVGAGESRNDMWEFDPAFE